MVTEPALILACAVVPGVPIMAAAAQACEIARRSNVWVEIEFHGYTLYAYPHSTVESVVRLYTDGLRKALKKANKVKKPC